MGSSVGDYEVFLSFRGVDTRQGFSNILYKYMSNAKIRVFRDDNALQLGDKICEPIFKAIVNSKICIPIFSPNFAQSKNCLLEVTKMVELKKIIIPIFYNVMSDDVKLKTPLYINDFKRLEEKYGNHEVDKWKEALKIAVSYKGRKVGDKAYCEFCEEFVDEVLSKLGPRELEVVSVGIDDMCGIGTAPAPAPTGTTPIAATFGAPVTVLGQEFMASDDVKLNTPLYSNVFGGLEDTNWYDQVHMWKQTLTKIVSKKGKKLGDSNSTERASSDGDYEIFLSFRGKDNRQGFADVLYFFMDNAKIRVFKDDKAIRIGDKIDSLFEAIVNSKICIPIFSPEFVQSKYCLIEVAKMVELKKTIIPIFHNVTLDDVKLETKLYVNDFKKLEEIYEKHQVDKWKQALKHVVSHEGRTLAGDINYSDFCKEFVAQVLSKLCMRSSSQDQQAAPYTIDLAIVHKMIQSAEGSFDVTDTNGTIVFKVKGHVFTKHRCRELLDTFGNTLLTLHHKVFKEHDRWQAFRGESTDEKDLLFMAKRSRALHKTKLHVYLGKNTKPNEDIWDYRVEGSWSEGFCIIYVGNTNNIVAHIHKKVTVLSALVGKNRFTVTVYPDIDYAFMVALVVIFASSE